MRKYKFHVWAAVLAVCTILLFPALLTAQYEHEKTVVSSGGGDSADHKYSTHITIGQPGAVGEMYGAEFLEAGYLAGLRKLQFSTDCLEQTAIPAIECEALVALHLSTNGGSWTDKLTNNWRKANVSPCDWTGITCSGGYVTGIDRSGQNLNGTLPPELGNFKNLQTLDLSDNSLLTGSIPMNMGTLSTLSTFYFDNTGLCLPEGLQTWLSGIPDVVGTGVQCPPLDYFVYDEYGGSWIDVNASGQTNLDENMCWAFTASNILERTSWTVPTTLETAPQIVNNYIANWENKAGMMKYAWRWWFDGKYPPELPGFDPEKWSQLSNPNPTNPDPNEKPHFDQNGMHFPEPISFFDQYNSVWKLNVMAAIKDYLHFGYGVGLRLYDGQQSTDPVGHALNVWGYRYYADGMVIGLWVTDSAPVTPDGLRLLPVNYLANWIDPDGEGPLPLELIGLKWRISESDGQGLGQYGGWLIEGAQALKPRNLHVLSVQKAGTGRGTVTSSPAAIDCGDTCVQTYGEPTAVTLTAAPESGSAFAGWQGACTGMDLDCLLTVDGDTQVKGIFESEAVAPHTITVNAGAGVTVLPGTTQALTDGSTTKVQVPEGGEVTILFTPESQYQVIDVLVDGRSIGAVTKYTFTNVTQNHTVEVKTLAKDNKLVMVTKKCLDQNNIEIDCLPGENGTIILNGEICDTECMKIVAQFAKNAGITMQFAPDAECVVCIGWEITDENAVPVMIEGVEYYTEEDLAVEAVIRCACRG